MKESRVARALMSWGVALFWNGITWTILYFILQDFRWFPVLFLGFFALIGLALLGLAVYTTMQLANPRTTVVASERFIYPGTEFEVMWMHEKSAARLAELTIEVEGTESATYRYGTSSRTDKQVFFHATIVSTKDPEEIQKGFHLLQLPSDTMHTFEAGSNSITWQINVHGRIRFWPDVTDTYAFTVYPPRIDENEGG